MNWRYIIYKDKFPDGKTDRYSIREIYDTDQNLGTEMFSAEPEELVAEEPEDLIWMLEHMLSDAKKYSIKEENKDIE